MPTKESKTCPKCWALSLAITLAVIVGCGRPSDQPREEPLNDSPPGVAEGVPGPEGVLPPGHPPIGQTAVATAPPPGSGSGRTGLSWTVDEAWVEETPSTGMRKAQYRIPHPSGDGECVVFYFGPGQGGEAMMNAVRWSEQFAQPDGQPSREALRTEEIEVGGIPVLLAEIRGTYTGGFMMGGSEQSFPGYMLLGAIAKGPDANWFFKFTGPEETLEANRAAFDRMIHSLKTGE